MADIAIQLTNDATHFTQTVKLCRAVQPYDTMKPNNLVEKNYVF